MEQKRISEKRGEGNSQKEKCVEDEGSRYERHFRRSQAEKKRRQRKRERMKMAMGAYGARLYLRCIFDSTVGAFLLLEE